MPILVLLFDTHSRLLVWASLQSNIELPTSPARLHSYTTLVLFLIVLAKYPIHAVLHLFGAAPQLIKRDGGTMLLLPKQQVVAPLHVSVEDLKQYRKAASYWRQASEDAKDERVSIERGRNPVFVLAAVTMPLLLLVLAKVTHPMLPLGAVNVRNRIDFVDPQACRSLVGADDLQITAHFGGEDLPFRRVKRGVEFDVHVVVSDWGNNKVIFREVFTILQVSRQYAVRDPINSVPSALDLNADVQMQTEVDKRPLSIEANGPDLWARVSKDYNPIHMSVIVAKLFGFAGRIVHGNHAVAMAMDMIEGQSNGQSSAINATETGLRTLWTRDKTPSFMEVEFKRPMIIPLTLQLHYKTNPTDTDIYNFDITSMQKGIEKIHIEARAGKLPAGEFFNIKVDTAGMKKYTP